MFVDTIKDIRMKIRRDDYSKWLYHAQMVQNYLTGIMTKKFPNHVEDFRKQSNDVYFIPLIAYGHDLFKGVSGHYEISSWNQNFTIDIPSKSHLCIDAVDDLIWYISHLLKLDDESKARVHTELISVGKYHGLNAAAFLYKNEVRDLKVLVPIIMHQCIVPSLYNVLSPTLQVLCESTVIADKCSRNVIKAYIHHQPVPFVLIKVLYGADGTEFNYSTALLLASILQQGESPSNIRKESTKMFKKRCEQLGIPVPKKCRLEAVNNSILIGEPELSDVRKDLNSEYGNWKENPGTDSTGESPKESQ